MLQKVGIGYDIHRFIGGRKLILGGVEIPYEKGLDGHSDADVLLHAICDAILGALGKGDIGEMFPNTDEKYRNISSLKLLKKINDMAKKEKYFINNVDTVVIAQKPHLKMFKEKMRFYIADALAIKKEAVNVKATTQEHLGALGRAEGIAAYAVVLLTKND